MFFIITRGNRKEDNTEIKHGYAAFGVQCNRHMFSNRTIMSDFTVNLKLHPA